MRLSKLQKWILKQTFKKTILLENEDLEVLKEFTSYRYKEGINKDEWYWRYLFRAEILLNYFNCATDNYKSTFSRLHHFKGDNNKEQATLSRSLKNMYDKGLIELWYGSHTRWQGIILTELGKEKAIGLLDIEEKDIVYPKLPTKEELEEKKRKRKLEIERIDSLLRS